MLAISYYFPYGDIFGDIWCQFVSFGPAPHIYQRDERVGGAVCTIHGHYPDYLVVGPAGQERPSSHLSPVTPLAKGPSK